MKLVVSPVLVSKLTDFRFDNFMIDRTFGLAYVIDNGLIWIFLLKRF